MPEGAVSNSNAIKAASASSADAPHIASVGRRLTHTAGRSGLPNNAQRRSGNSWIQGIPAGLPPLIPGMGEEIEGAMQHAPQPLRQVMSEAMSRSQQRKPSRDLRLKRRICRLATESTAAAKGLAALPIGTLEKVGRGLRSAPEPEPEPPTGRCARLKGKAS